MDKQLLDALNNLSVALESIAESLNAKDKKGAKSATTEAMTSGNLDKNVLEIKNGVKKVIEDNKKILANQETILKMSKVKEVKSRPDKIERRDTIFGVGKTKEAESKEDRLIFDQKKKIGIKDGLSIILLIAAGVLALGMAFKIVGKIDFFSVIALSVALPLLAFAFEKISKIKLDPKQTFMTVLTIAGSVTAASFIMQFLKTFSFEQGVTAIFIAGVFAIVGDSLGKLIESTRKTKITAKDLLFLPFVLTAMSLSITLSSIILNGVLPISIAQGITAILIASTFSIISYGLSGLLKGLKDVNVVDLEKLPFVLVTMALAIVGSSFVLQFVIPVGPLQLFTSLAISLTFVALSYSLAKILNATKEMDVEKLPMLPALLATTSLAIALSSLFFAMIVPITFDQFATAIGVALTFIPISLAVVPLAYAVSRIQNWSKFGMVPVLMTIMAAAIYGASLVFPMVQTVSTDTLMDIGKIALTLGVMGLVLTIPFILISKSNLTFKDSLEASKILVLMAATISISSGILSLGNYQNYPSLDWLLGVGSSMIAFGLISTGLGLLIDKAGQEKFYSGLGSLVVISGAISASAYILNLSEYGKYPSLDWALGVGSSLLAFGVLGVALGAAVTMTGLGFGALALGLASMVLISGAISLSAFILNKSNYGKYPSVDWALGVGTSLGLIGLVAAGLGIGSLLIGPGLIVMLAISFTVAESAEILNKADYGKYPSEAWALGVGTSIGKIGLISAGLGIGSLLILPGLIVMLAISKAVTETSNILSGGNYTKFPSLPWTKSVGEILVTFAKTSGAIGFAILTTFGLGFLAFKSGLSTIKDIATSIVETAQILGGGNYGIYPTKDWIDGVGDTLLKFGIAAGTVGVAVLLTLGIGYAGLLVGLSSIEKISETVVSVSNILQGGNFTKYPSMDWSMGVIKSLEAFNSLSMSSVISSIFSGGLKSVAESIISVSEVFGNSTTTFDVSKVPSAMWSSNVSQAIGAFLPILNLMKDSDQIFKSGSDVINEGITGLANSLVNTASILNGGDFTKIINPNWISNLKSTIQIYTDLANFVETKNAGDIDISDTVDGLVTLSESYGTMANNLEKLNAQINNINLEKMAALKSLTGSVILLSLMDPDQFENMMDALEDKSQIFSDVIDAMEGGKSPSLTTTDVKVGSTQNNERSLNDLYNILNTINNTSSSGLRGVIGEVDKLSKKVTDLSSKLDKTSLKPKQTI